MEIKEINKIIKEEKIDKDNACNRLLKLQMLSKKASYLSELCKISNS